MSKINRLGLMAMLISCWSCSAEKEVQEDGVIAINGTNLYVESVGEGEPIIVIHGGPVLDHSYIQPYLEDLENDYRLIYFDQRLSGRSDGEVDSSGVSIQAFVEDIDGIRRHFGYDKVHVMGHSWGGLLAMEYATRYSDYVESLLLINSIAPSNSLWMEEQNALQPGMSASDSIRRQEILRLYTTSEIPSSAIEELLKLSFKYQLADTSQADRLDFFIPDDYIARSGKFSLLQGYLATYDLREDLRSLSIPALVVYGENEPSKYISGPVLQNDLQNSQLVVMEDCGHFPFLEQPNAFIQLVRDFLGARN